MILAMLLAGQLALAGGVSLVRPERPDPVPGECPRSLPLRVGEPVPPELVDGDGLVRCAAVAEPVSSLAYLLSVERHRDAIERLHESDLTILEAERDWYNARWQGAAAPPVWYKRPTVQRWAGRIETLFTVSIVALAYNGVGR